MSTPSHKFRFLICLLLTTGLITAAMQARAQRAVAKPGTASREPDGLNKLSPAEKKAGWKLLFDGKTTSGWRAFGKATDVPTGWIVENGSLTTPGGKGDLVSANQYENFELDFQWKIAPKGNSGLMFRVVDDGTHARTYETGPEFQLIDDENYPMELKEVQKTAANYDLQPASKKTGKPAGEWNHSRLIVKNGLVQHWLNGTKVVEYQIGSEAWKKQVQGSKFASMPGYAKAAKGHIALQDHGDQVWFRTLKIKDL
jgi:hypothetical protein